MSAKSQRYKGTAPFLDQRLDRKTFFGRDREIRSLSSLVLAERLVVLFSKSGMGKTSLINAGLMQPLRARGYFPMSVRAGDPVSTPARAVIDGVRAAARDAGVDCVGGEEKSLWRFFKTVELWSESEDLLRPILILDQFEELFTLQTEEQRRALAAELAELVRGRAGAGREGDPASASGRTLDSGPPALKIVISLREDFLAELQDLAGELPGILQNRFRLGPLTREGAEEAIVGPAELADEAFVTAPFSYREEAVREIIAFLCKGRRGAKTIEVDEVDPVQLQLICQYLEEVVRERQRSGEAVEVTDRDLGGERQMQVVLQNFYDRTIRALRPRSLRRRVRKLCEKRLISSSGRRLTEDGDEIHRQYKISKEQLQGLVDARLLRSEPRLGGTFYELSHDTLIAPVRESGKKRRRRRRRAILTFAALVVILPVGCALSLGYLVSMKSRQLVEAGPEPGQVLDEARLAGRTADTFWAADEDYFSEMDGGITDERLASELPFLTPEEARQAVVRGHNAWMVWTGGNDRFWDWMAGHTFGAVDLLKTITSPAALGYEPWDHQGLLREPCFERAMGPDPERYGLWLDRRNPDCPPDPFENEEKYPGVQIGARGANIPIGSYYGYASGIVGLRLFPNPDFDDKAERRWDPERFYFDPSYSQDQKLVRPYRVGMSCGFCHVGPSPTRPPEDPRQPAWENLSPTFGNQYLRASRVFLWNDDPSSFAQQLLESWRPGTLDGSFVASDSIHNPRAIEPIQGLMTRLRSARRWAPEILSGGAVFNTAIDWETGEAETLEDGYGVYDVKVWPPRLLKDGADSAGVAASIQRMAIEHGLFSEEWLLHFSPLGGGSPAVPVEIPDLARNSAYWNATVEQSRDMALFLAAAGEPHRLAAAPGGEDHLTRDAARLETGKRAFARHCASCHSSKLPPLPPPSRDDDLGGAPAVGAPQAGGAPPPPPEFPDDLPSAARSAEWNEYWTWTQTEDFKQEMEALVLADDFLEGNYLSNDRRVPVTLLGTNICSALASNATTGEIWYNFSSRTYRELPAVGATTLLHPLTEELYEYELPAAGRGYTRVPSLLSLWATAPYLLNNSLGEHSADPSVAWRVASFEEGMRQLLWPEVRGLWPDSTTQTSYLKLRVPDGPLARLIDDQLLLGPIPEGTPIGLLASARIGTEAGATSAERIERAKSTLAVLSTFKDLAKRLPANPGREETQQVFSELVEPLLRISACPDFVVNRGHTFGSDLPHEEKLALLQYLKTF